MGAVVGTHEVAVVVAAMETIHLRHIIFLCNHLPKCQITIMLSFILDFNKVTIPDQTK